MWPKANANNWRRKWTRPNVRCMLISLRAWSTLQKVSSREASGLGSTWMSKLEIRITGKFIPDSSWPSNTSVLSRTSNSKWARKSQASPSSVTTPSSRWRTRHHAISWCYTWRRKVTQTCSQLPRLFHTCAVPTLTSTSESRRKELESRLPRRRLRRTDEEEEDWKGDDINLQINWLINMKLKPLIYLILTRDNPKNHLEKKQTID